MTEERSIYDFGNAGISILEVEIKKLQEENARLRTALDTVGQTIYTQGRGTKIERGLLKFIRQALGRE